MKTNLISKLTVLIPTFSYLYADDKIDDPVVQETCGNRKMISQILNSTFTFQGAVDHGVVCPAGLEVIARETNCQAYFQIYRGLCNMSNTKDCI